VGTARLLLGDVRERIAEIADESVDLVCTSPPFLALRNYGGDDADAREMGSEDNPADFITNLLGLTAQFRRVLAPHGSIAIELGDTYSGSPQKGFDYDDERQARGGQPKFRQGYVRNDREKRPPQTSGKVGQGTHSNPTLPNKTKDRSTGRWGQRLDTSGSGWPLAKSLAGVPEAYMLSLAYGFNVLDRRGPDSPAGLWRVRNVIVWARPNPPVGALGDKVRPATSYITVACTSAKRWFDLDAVRTEHANPDDAARGRVGNRNEVRAAVGLSSTSAGGVPNPAGAPPLDWWEDDDPTGHATLVLPTAPYPGAHYATWPPKLAQRLIEMMCPSKVCTTCGEPSRRLIGDVDYVPDKAHRNAGRMFDATRAAEGVNQWEGTGQNKGMVRQAETTGWSDCGHDTWRPGLVLDPFAGSGTSLAVATGCGRDAVGIELYEKNAALIRDRVGMFLIKG
jgi:hypothetical protein